METRRGSPHSEPCIAIIRTRPLVRALLIGFETIDRRVQRRLSLSSASISRDEASIASPNPVRLDEAAQFAETPCRSGKQQFHFFYSSRFAMCRVAILRLPGVLHQLLRVSSLRGMFDQSKDFAQRPPTHHPATKQSSPIPPGCMGRRWRDAAESAREASIAFDHQPEP
jgi:hypothetical protein